MIKLERCPFCKTGKGVRWNNEIFKPVIDENGACIDIDNEEADVFGVECSEAECPCQLIGFDTQEAADEAWNHSAQLDTPPLTLEEWGEDDGDCLWWTFPIDEPPYCGSPICCDWPEYHTHFTRIDCPSPPEGGEG